MRLSLRRVAVRLAILAVLAGATVVALAWASAAFTRFGTAAGASVFSQGLSPTEWWSVTRKRGPLGDQITSIVMPRAQEYKERPPEAELPYWAAAPEPISSGAWPNNHYEITQAHGWPMRALSFRFRNQGGTKVNAVFGPIRGGIELASDQKSAWYQPRALPITPIWTGLLVNALTFAAAWWMILEAWVRVRAWRRARRGLCGTCGYDLRGTSGPRCPECGKDRPPPRGTLPA